MSESQPGDLWDAIGALDELEAMQVLTKLFATYEELLQRDPDNPEIKNFFQHLKLALDQAKECNLNRR